LESNDIKQDIRDLKIKNLINDWLVYWNIW
jgi:hypothetical protein